MRLEVVRGQADETSRPILPGQWKRGGCGEGEENP